MVNYMIDYIIILIIIIFEEFFKYKIKKISFKIIKQLMFVMGYISLFFTSAAISNLSNKDDSLVILLYALVIIQFFVYLLVYVSRKVNIFSYFKECVINGGIKNVIIKYRFQISVFSLTFSSRIWQINTVQKWDSEVYYYAIMNACDNFNFTADSFWRGFELVSHPSYAYGFWTGIGAFLFPNGIEGILLVILLMTCIANVKLYGLLRSYWTTMTHKQAFLGTVMCTFIPLYWGTYSYLMPDYLIIVFIIFMLDAKRQEKWITFFFWSLMVCFSKEIGIVMIFSYFAAKSLYILVVTSGSIKDRVISCIKEPSICVGLLDGLIIFLYMILNRGISSWKHSVYYSDPISWDNTVPSELLYNTFGIQSDNIITRLKQYFLVNFAWVFSTILIISIVVYIYRRKTSLKIEKIVETSAILLGYGIFMCLYITAGVMRYNVAFSVLFTVISYVILVDICSKRFSQVITMIIAGFLFIQSFYSIDVVTNKLFRTVDVGNTKLLCISQDSHKYPGGDYYVNNLQYITINKNIEKMLKAVNFTENDILLIAGKDYLECAQNYSLTEINGRNNTIEWNNDTAKYRNNYNSNLPIVYSILTNTMWGRESIPNIDNLGVTEQVKNTLNRVKGRLFVYFSPLYQSENRENLLEQLELVFELGEMKKVETWGNQLEFCELYVKSANEIESLNLDIEEESLTAEQRKRKDYYSRLQEFAVNFSNTGRSTTEYGDTIAVTIAAYEDGKYVNLGYSPKGTVLHTITLGTNQVFSKIEEALVNREIGEVIPITFRFPDNYQNNKEVAGREMELRITVNSIQKQIPKDIMESYTFEN